MQTEILRILRKSNKPVDVTELAKSLDRSVDEVEKALLRMPKIVILANGKVSLK
jgi:predicted transcriptional regulator